jgi:hypothetical protein
VVGDDPGRHEVAVRRRDEHGEPVGEPVVPSQRGELGTIVGKQEGSSGEREARQRSPARRIRAGRSPEDGGVRLQAQEPEVSGDPLALVRTLSSDSATIRTSLSKLSILRGPVAFREKAAAAYQKPIRSGNVRM